MQRRELTVPRSAVGQRLDSWLADELGATRSQVARLIDRQSVTIDGAAVSRAQRLTGGERVVVEQDRPEVAEQAAAQAVIVWEDESLLVVDKPAGLVVHPAAGHRKETLIDQLQRHASGAWQPMLVHRLDKDTSGLMLVAKDATTHRRLQSALRARRVARQYLALVKGRPKSRRGTIEAPLGRDRRVRTRMSIDTDKPRPAVTRFEIEAEFAGCTLLRVVLESGRTHQIRAHLAAIDLPVCGDPEYGIAGYLGLTRQFLHSSRLCFEHPISGQTLDFDCALPPDLEGVLSRLAQRAALDR